VRLTRPPNRPRNVDRRHLLDIRSRVVWNVEAARCGKPPHGPDAPKGILGFAAKVDLEPVSGPDYCQVCLRRWRDDDGAAEVAQYREGELAGS
jgi:hypothetical protein